MQVKESSNYIYTSKTSKKGIRMNSTMESALTGPPPTYRSKCKLRENRHQQTPSHDINTISHYTQSFTFIIQNELSFFQSPLDIAIPFSIPFTDCQSSVTCMFWVIIKHLKVTSKHKVHI